MKSKIIIAIALLTATISANAQYFSLGPSVGFHHSWIAPVISGGEKNVFNPGFNAGISAVYSTESHFGIGADLKYSLEGTSVQTEFQSVETESNWNTSYLRLPVRVLYFFGEYGDAVRPKLFLGPSLGFLLASKSDDVDVMDFTNSFDLGLHGGAGVNIRLMEKVWLNADVTYTQGLVDVTEDAFDNTNNLNGNIGVNAGVLFGF